MTDFAVRVTGLGKRYTLGGGDAGKRSLYQDLVQSIFPFLPQRTSGPTDAKMFWALKDLSFEIKQGEVVGIIGRNGSGKSTLLKLLAQITAPTEGSVELNGRLGALLEVGTGFHPELTGRQNIFLNGIMLGMTEAEVAGKLDAIVEFAEVNQFIDVPVKRYSSGMHVRLAFAVAAHLDSDILVLDEVLSVGDLNFQKKCLGKVGEAATSGRTVLIVSHDMLVVQKACTRGFLIEKGQVIMDESMNSVVHHYMDLGIQRRSERLWDDDDSAPHFDDRSVRLLTLRVVNAEGRTSEFFDVSEPLTIEVEYRVLKRKHACVVQMFVRNDTGHTAFVAMDAVRDRPAVQAEGLHRVRCHLPGNLLNEGTIRLGVVLVPRGDPLEGIKRDDALIFTIRDENRPGAARGDWIREWPAAVIRPKLAWEYVDDISRRAATTDQASLQGVAPIADPRA